MVCHSPVQCTEMVSDNISDSNELITVHSPLFFPKDRRDQVPTLMGDHFGFKFAESRMARKRSILTISAK